MHSQFVDLFDKDRYGVNYWAVIALFVGLMMEWVGFGLRIAYQVGVLDWGIENPVGVVLGDFPGRVAYSLGFAMVLVVLCHVLKKDIMLPVAAGVAMIVVGSVMRTAGLAPEGESEGILLLGDFAYGLFVSGALVLSHRLMQNKLQALFLGFVTGKVLLGALGGAQAYLLHSAPIGVVAQFAFAPMPAAFLAGVFFYAGISYHFDKIGIGFTEYGLLSAAPSDGAAGFTESAVRPLGKTRKPLATTLLLAATANLYAFAWIHKVYSEVRTRSPGATSVTPSRALGFLFIPLFNFFWVVWLFIDLPRAIRRMEEHDPPSGVSLDRGLITGLLVGGVAAGLVGAYVWPTAALLAAVLLWAGILSAQSALNSHWQAHRARGGRGRTSSLTCEKCGTGYATEADFHGHGAESPLICIPCHQSSGGAGGGAKTSGRVSKGGLIAAAVFYAIGATAARDVGPLALGFFGTAIALTIRSFVPEMTLGRGILVGLGGNFFGIFLIALGLGDSDELATLIGPFLLTAVFLWPGFQRGKILWRKKKEEEEVPTIPATIEQEEEKRQEIVIPESPAVPVVRTPQSDGTRWLWDRLHKIAIPFGGLSIGDEISHSQIETARADFAPLGDGEVPLALIDSTATSTGEDGVLITDQAVYWKVSGTGHTGSRAYADLPEVSPVTESRAGKGLELEGVVKLRLAPGVPDAAVVRLATFLNQARKRAPSWYSGNTAKAEVEPERLSREMSEDRPAPAVEARPLETKSPDPEPAPSEEPDWHPCVIRMDEVTCECPACGDPKYWPLSIFSRGSEESAPDLRSTERALSWGRPIVGQVAAFVVAGFVGAVIVLAVGEPRTWITFVAVAIFLGIRPILVPALTPKLPVWEVTCGTCGAGFRLAVGKSEALMGGTVTPAGHSPG